MSEKNTIVLASDSLAMRLGVEKAHLLNTIKAQCFRNTAPERVSDTQLAAYVQIASNLHLNPLLPGMLYAYPERNGGITPIIGPDGVFLMLANNPEVEGWWTRHESVDNEPACTAVIKHRRLGEISKTVFMGEWKVASNPNWVTRPRHMLEIRALKQCARQIIHGVPFDDEEYAAMRVVDDGLAHEAPPPRNVTPAQAAPARPRAPARAAQGAAAVRENRDEVAKIPNPEIPNPKETPNPESQAPMGGAAAPAAGSAACATAAEDGEFTLHDDNEPPAEPAKPDEPVTRLAPEQRATFKGLEVVSVANKLINKQPSVIAEVKGGYTGTVYHIGGADNPAWEDTAPFVASPVSLTLVGKATKNGNGVIAVVEKAEVEKRLKAEGLKA